MRNVKTIACSDNHSVCLDYEGIEYGQLGLGDTNDRYKPIKHPSLSNIIDISNGGYHSIVKTSNNEIYAFGYNEYSQLGIKTKDKNQTTPVQVFQGNEDIWSSNINCTSRIKSARK